MTRYDLLDIRAALDKASYWARKQADLFQIIDAKKKVEALLNEPSLPSNLDLDILDEICNCENECGSEQTPAICWQRYFDMKRKEKE